MTKAKFDLQGILKQKGTKHQGFIEIARKVDGSSVRIPYIILVGAQDGPTLLVDCCHHGDEYEGAEGIIKITRELDPKDIKGALVTVPVINLEAFADGQRIAKMDWSFQDMNRAYPGDPEGLITKRITAFYRENFIAHADYMITFHGGGNSLYLEPLCAFAPSKKEGKTGETAYKLAKAFGVKVVWGNLGDAPFTGTTTTMSTQYDLPLIAPELGGQCVRHDLREENVNLCANGIKNVMMELDMLPGKPAKVEGQIEVGIRYLHTDEGGIHKPLKKVYEECKKGEVLSEITDLFGNKVGEVIAPYDGVVIGYWAYSTIHPGNWAFLYGSYLD